MCGIAGIIDLRNNSKTSLSLLKRMSDEIIHRGPDSEGQWLSEDRKMGMSFRRLSIIDLSENGSQPMHSPDGRYSISFNGEIYNHKEIRKNLKKEFNYRGNSDTETILYGFIKYGKDIFQKMVGMWGISIWDNHEKKLILSRDRIGIKPLYYYKGEGFLVYGSEIKSIIQHPDVKKELNLNELPNYLNLGMSSRNETLFANIKKLKPASILEIDANFNIRINQYWNILDHTKQKQKLNQKEIQDNVIDILRSSIKSRMMSDVPFGVFLSGGIDSSLNVALMSELMERPVDTFTVGFKELEKFNELEHARKISKMFKTNHNEILIDENDAMPILSDLAWHEDEPNADPVCIPLYFLSKLTKDSGTTVIQVGEGSDEQFVGYKWMIEGYKFYNSWWKYYSILPSFFKKSLFNITNSLLNGKVPDLALEYLRRASYGEQFYQSGVPVLSVLNQKELLNNKRLCKIPSEYSSSLYQDFNDFTPDYLQKVLYLELKQRLAELLLMRVDKITMAHSLESRVPFLDHRLVEFTMSLNESQRLPDRNISKYILKKAVEDILPHDIIYRKKMGFAAPVDNWFRGPWKSFAEDRLLNSELSKLGLFNHSYLKEIMKKHQNEKSKLGSKIYSLVNLSLWYDRFF